MQNILLIANKSCANNIAQYQMLRFWSLQKLLFVVFF